MSTENHNFVPENKGSIRAVAIGVLLVAAIWLLIRRFESNMNQPLAKAMAEKAAAIDAREEIEEQARVEEKAVQDMQQIRAKESWKQLEITANYVIETTDRLLVTMEEQRKLRNTLLQSDAAEYLPHSEQALREFPVDEQHFSQYEHEVALLRRKAEALLDQSRTILQLEAITTAVDPDTEEDAEKLKRIGLQLAANVDVEAAMLRRIMQTRTSPKKNAGQTVADVVASWESDKEKAEAEALTKALEETRAKAEAERIEAAQKLEEARLRAETDRIEAEKELLELKAAKEMQEAEARKQEAIKLAAAEKISQEIAAREKEADRAMQNDMAQIQKYFAQFIKHSNRQLRGDGYTSLSIEPAPISLTSLQAYGATEANDRGCHKLKMAMGILAAKGERGPAPIDVTEFDPANALPALQLLIKHGDAMVRAGLLSK